MEQRRSIVSGVSGSPELNPAEHLWDMLREKHFHNRAFESIDALENHLIDLLRDMENDVGSHHQHHTMVLEN
jgi:hypothetical protein